MNTKINRHFILFNRMAFIACAVLLAALSVLFRPFEDLVYNISFLMLFHLSFYYMYVGRMTLRVEGDVLHYKRYNRILTDQFRIDNQCRWDVCRRWGVDAVRISHADSGISFVVYPDDVPLFLQTLQKIKEASSSNVQ